MTQTAIYYASNGFGGHIPGWYVFNHTSEQGQGSYGFAGATAAEVTKELREGLESERKLKETNGEIAQDLKNVLGKILGIDPTTFDT